MTIIEEALIETIAAQDISRTGELLITRFCSTHEFLEDGLGWAGSHGGLCNDRSGHDLSGDSSDYTGRGDLNGSDTARGRGNGTVI
jgi:hypothetical protein